MFRYHNIPNLLTFVRILIVPIIVVSFYSNNIKIARQISSLLFLIASITDFLDGYVARKYHCQSQWGRIFDPVADKILVSSVLLMMVKFNMAQEIPCLLILARELLVSAVRELIATDKIKLPASYLGKIKTVLQMSAIVALLIGSEASSISWMSPVGNILLWLSCILSMVSVASYLKNVAKCY
jgi:CDP-diacylglycerol--glycerol-3-phosphate 3-phosphatidyltransferase